MPYCKTENEPIPFLLFPRKPIGFFKKTAAGFSSMIHLEECPGEGKGIC